MKKPVVLAILLVAATAVSFGQSATPQPAQSTQAAQSTPAASPDTTPAQSAPSEPAAGGSSPTEQAAPVPEETLPAASPPARAPSYMEQELDAARSELSSGQVGALTMDDIEKIAFHLSIAVQKERYVQRMRNASFALPGLGQFMTGDNLGGWLFVAWDVTILAGTFVGAYLVLPPNVQFGSLDYLNSSLSTIRSAWLSNSLVSYFPLVGVIAGGIILETVLRYVSADSAEKTARKNIDEGKVTFQPTLDFGDGGLGLGMRVLF
ncbi:MAG TPA: hypothetical protein VL354_04880 [Spirochaetia bacterium]|nr:hypothetical protein [Spirochaetia bacterium]